MGYHRGMFVWALEILAAWILVSFPVAVVVGRMFAARSDDVTGHGWSPTAEPHRVAHLSLVSLVESRPSDVARLAS